MRVLSAGAVVFVMVAASTTRICAEQNTDATAGFKSALEILRRDSAQEASQRTEDWLERVKKSVAGNDLKAALQAVDARLAAVPEDSDAMGWRAQILAWMGQREDAEATYRRALRLSPKDGDFLLGLATLLAQDERNEDALALLDEAATIPPMRADVLNERGRVLRALGRRDEARAAFLQAEALEPRNISVTDDDARAGLRSLEAPLRYEIDIGNETDTFNYTGAANAQMITFVAKPDARWIFSTEADIYQRFGANAEKLIGSVTYRLTPSDAFTVGGGGGDAQGIIPRAETYVAYGHGFRISEKKAVRGIEATYNQHWFWYEQAGVLVFTGTVATNFAHDFRWTMSGNAARSRFNGAAVAWEPSGYGRLDFPAPRAATNRLLLNLTFAVGSENFSEVDQVGAFASRTYAGGFRLGLTERNYINFYVARQERNGGNSETSYGVSYGLRF
ncbi:MAG TPA: tetratricopeptide repeat protein [Candidatus Acidoferrales bacterium]|nr:tetratricopeptide repeat protein [Candidatus Acidoferrales bacterium]